MKEKIKLGIPIENEETGETNIILRTNEIRIVEEAFEEIERLNNIIKEVREYIEKEYVQVKNKEYNLSWNNLEYIIKEILEILDKGE